MMKVSEKKARRLLTNMGFSAPEGQAKLVKRLLALPDLLDDAKPLESNADMDLRDEIVAAVEGGEGIELSEEGDENVDETSNGHGHHGGTAVKTAPKKGAKKSEASKKTTASSTKKPEAKTETKKETKAATSRAKSMILGYATPTVLRWMGHEGFSYQEAEKVLSKHKIDMKETTVRTYLSDGKREDEKYGAKAALKPAEKKQLREQAGKK